MYISIPTVESQQIDQGRGGVVVVEEEDDEEDGEEDSLNM